MGWKSKAKNDWKHVNQLIQHFNDYALKSRVYRWRKAFVSWGAALRQLITDIERHQTK